MSSAQLGELVVSISADIARFQADMGKSVKTTETTMRQIQSTVDGGVNDLKASFAKIGSAFAAVTAVAAGGALFKDMIDSTKAWNGEVMKLSKTMGMSVQDASAYNTALRIAGIDQDTATAATAKLTKTLATNQEAFQRHGIAIKDASGKLLPMSQIIANTFESLGKLQSGASRNTAAMDLFGKSWVQLQSMAKLTNPLLAESKQLSDDLGLTLNGKTSEAVKKYGMEMNRLKLVHEGFKVAIGREVIGPLGELEAAITKILTKGGALRDTIRFMAHPIEFTQRQASFFAHPGDRFPMPERPAHGGDEYDPAKAAAAAAAAEKQHQAALAAAAAEEQRQNEYVKTYNQLQTDRSRLRVQESLDLTATQKKVGELQLKYDDLIKQYPEHRDELEKNLQLDKQNITNLGAKADALKLQNAEMKQSIALYEELNKDMTGFGGYAKGLGMNALELPKIGGSLGKNGAVFGGMPKYSLNGVAETQGLMGNGTDQAIEAARKEAEERKLIEERLNQELMASKMQFAEQSLALLEMSSKKGSAIAIAAAIAQKGLAVAQILMNTEAAATAALLPPPVGLGPIAGQGLSAEIRAMGYMNAALTGAIGVAQIAGQRAAGGPVTAGQTYLVGEKGPELFTAGASGTITPNDRLGGSSLTQYVTVDARGADQGVELRINNAMKRAKEEAKAEIFNDMNRGGKFAVASGRATR